MVFKMQCVYLTTRGHAKNLFKLYTTTVLVKCARVTFSVFKLTKLTIFFCILCVNIHLTQSHHIFINLEYYILQANNVYGAWSNCSFNNSIIKTIKFMSYFWAKCQGGCHFSVLRSKANISERKIMQKRTENVIRAHITS